VVVFVSGYPGADPECWVVGGDRVNLVYARTVYALKWLCICTAYMHRVFVKTRRIAEYGVDTVSAGSGSSDSPR
jgi:hypothetical protein